MLNSGRTFLACARQQTALASVRAAVAVGVLGIVGLLAFLASQAPGSSLAQVERPYMAERDVVVLSGRSVCSLIGTAKSGAGIVGQDGGHSIAVDGKTYWTFGDTALSTGGLLPNSVAWTDDTDASDCMNLVPKEENGRATPLLERQLGELTVWPSDMELVTEETVYFYYASVLRDPVESWRVAGVGIASFDLADLAGERLLDGLLVWKPPEPLPNRMFSDDEYVYSLLNSQGDVWVTNTILSRVPRKAFDSPAAYQYWEPTTGEWISGLWDATTSSWDAALRDVTPILRQFGLQNGVDVAYNEFLGSWLGVYATNVATSINVRATQDPLGPWSDQQTVLVDCLFQHGPTTAPFLCYTGIQHEMYSRDGGRTIYITYSHGGDYQVYLHEIRLASAITEWVGPDGALLYLPGIAPAPTGFEAAGLGFYASDIPVPGFSAIHRYSDNATGQYRYGAASPAEGDYQDLGVAFYAPTSTSVVSSTNEVYGPVYRWTLGDEEVYSPMNLADAGYERREVAFYSPCPAGAGEAEATCLEPARGSDVLLRDSDGDGCSDAEELGSDERLGGQRDPENYWDFYDVAIGGRAPGRDGEIDLFNDILAVVARLSSHDDGGTAQINRYSDPTSPIPDDGSAYHPAFDRSPPGAGGERWNLGPPDGRIDLVDLIGIIFSYGHTCFGS